MRSKFKLKVEPSRSRVTFDNVGVYAVLVHVGYTELYHAVADYHVQTLSYKVVGTMVGVNVSIIGVSQVATQSGTVGLGYSTLSKVSIGVVSASACDVICLYWAQK